MRPALFLDRDGVINEEVGYISRFDQVRFVPGIVPLISTANRLGFSVIVITNQAGIGMGLYTEIDFHAVMTEIRGVLDQQGAHIDDVYFSPFHPERGIGNYRQESACRKPGPGMILQAAREHGLDLERSCLVGDRGSDILAGAAAGVPRRFLLCETLPSDCPESVTYNRVNDLAEVERALGEATPQ